MWPLLAILTDRNSACSLFALVILVFVSDKSRANSFFRNSFILSVSFTQSSLEPLTPMIQSSAYLMYSNFLNFGSMSSLDGIWCSIRVIANLSDVDLALSFCLENFFHKGLIEALVPKSNSSLSSATKLSSLSR